jgi:glutaredoxin 3
MADVTIYTTIFCPYCWRAKKLLADKGIDFEEIDVTMRPGDRRHMTELAGGSSTVPQIFVGAHHVGGSDELYALDVAGELEPLLEAGQ